VVKLIIMLKRRAGMSREDFVDYYESNHRRLGEKYVPNATRYVRRYLEPVTGPSSDEDDLFDVVTELWFKDDEQLAIAITHLADPQIRAEIVQDEENLFDRSRRRAYFVNESESTVAQ